MSKLSLGFGKYRLTTDDRWLNYQGGFGKGFRLQLSDISGVSVDGVSLGKSVVRIQGNGTELATININERWAKRIQEYILNEISSE